MGPPWVMMYGALTLLERVNRLHNEIEEYYRSDQWNCDAEEYLHLRRSVDSGSFIQCNSTSGELPEISPSQNRTATRGEAR